MFFIWLSYIFLQWNSMLCQNIPGKITFLEFIDLNATTAYDWHQNASCSWMDHEYQIIPALIQLYYNQISFFHRTVIWNALPASIISDLPFGRGLQGSSNI